MKCLVLLFALILSFPDTSSQELIAVSQYPSATTNHNQRKIVRDEADHIYVVFVDSTKEGRIIKGLMYMPETETWSEPVQIVMGNNPTLAISSNKEICLVYESNDSIPRIKTISTSEFTTWSPELTVSDSSKWCGLPVADFDSSGNLNLFFLQRNPDSTSSLIYALIKENTLISRKLVATKSSIEDVAVANHLLYLTDDLIFGIQYTRDSLEFYRSKDHLNTLDTIYAATGSQPCISFNFYIPGDFNAIKLLYIDRHLHLIEVDLAEESETYIFVTERYGDRTDYVCIDDIAPPIGYSYLFMHDQTLYHGFSYGGI